MDNSISALYKDLRKKYGRPEGQWKLWCKRPKTLTEREEVVVGAILTQNTNWKNVEYALANLKKEKLCSLSKINGINKLRLSRLVKPSGFYNQKTDYLKRTAKFIDEECGGLRKLGKKPLVELKKELTALKGLGRETADSIILYALDKPVFVIDAYTRRLAKKLNLTDNLSYLSLQNLFESNLPRSYKLYQDFHALIVINEKQGR